jgi:hypothetical protein
LRGWSPPLAASFDASRRIRHHFRREVRDASSR